ncbi:hypothetical protein TNCV_4935331 [Trichonephila clavipes]|nr:hypothetical protein TNCV_4935331 [Trichonephila clavipes]
MEKAYDYETSTVSTPDKYLENISEKSSLHDAILANSKSTSAVLEESKEIQSPNYSYENAIDSKKQKKRECFKMSRRFFKKIKIIKTSGISYQRQNDEAHFWLNGYVNKQNCRIWREANPQKYVETPLHPEKLTVWCALWAGGILLQKR